MPCFARLYFQNPTTIRTPHNLRESKGKDVVKRTG